MSSRVRIGLLAVVALVAGCQQTPVRDPNFAAAAPLPSDGPAAHEGTVYRAGFSRFLFEDLRPSRVGDILLVELVEKTDASKTAETSIAKDSSIEVDNPTLLGTSPQFSVPGVLPLASTANLNLEFNTNSSHSFDGSGESSQGNSLEGSVTVVVAQVLANGNLVVQGEKIVTLNNGPEFVRVSGIVRPEDIRPDNSVLSTRLANVEIVYGGQGEVADASKLGWLARFFISAIFPF